MEKSEITSEQKSFCFRDKSLTDIIHCYPEMKSVNDRGREVTEYNNKYWLMLSEAETAALYPQKGMQK